MENFLMINSASSLIANGGYISAVRYSGAGEVILVSPDGDFHFGCAGGANIVLSGAPIDYISDTYIYEAEVNWTEIRITFGNGLSIVLEDETGGEGIEIWRNIA